MIVQLAPSLRRLRRKASVGVDFAIHVAPASGLVARVLVTRRRRCERSKPLLDVPADFSVEASERATQQAQHLIENGFKLRNNPAWKPKLPIDWGKNPRADSNWHYIINNFEPVEQLLNAYRLGGGDQYYTLARRVAIDWIKYNLLRDLPNEKKWHDMATALRARVFSQILDTELRRPGAHIKDITALIWGLEEHAKFLADPTHFPVGNHAVFMMWGLAYILRVLPELEASDGYRSYAARRMQELLPLQFSSEGFHLEHSAEYHLYLTETLADMVDNDLLPELGKLPELVARAKSHFHELYHPNGDLVMLGDSERRAGDSRSAEALRHRPQASKTERVRAYPETGYAMIRSHFGDYETPLDDYLFLGAGHHSRIHKHADHLSFEWSFQGLPVLVDSGKYTYNRDYWLRFVRTTRAGNAVEVDQRNYDRTPREGRGGIVAWGQTDDLAYVVARQSCARVEVQQTRVLVVCSGRFLLVLDRLQSSTAHVYRQWFHFHESLQVDEQAQGLSVSDADNRRLLWVQELSGSASIERFKGVRTPRTQGFISPSYLRMLPRFSVAFCKRASTTDCATLFSAEPAAEAQLVEENGTLTVRWRDPRGKAQGIRFTPGLDQPLTPVSA